MLTWLADCLREAGCVVSEVPGWEHRTIPGPWGPIKGVLCHHTAGPLHGTNPCLPTIIHGRIGLHGPLSNLHLSRTGVFSVVAAGRCNHAGLGEWHGVTGGNTHFIGIEAENTGLPNDPWPEHQLVEYARGCAALAKYVGFGVEMVVGHKEYALPDGRKTDPSFDMDEFRDRVAAARELLA